VTGMGGHVGARVAQLLEEHADVEVVAGCNLLHPRRRLRRARFMRIDPTAVELGRRHDVPVTALRMAPVCGARVPSPIGRLLRLPAITVPALADPPFALLHPGDAARAVVAALRTGWDGPLNVAGPGAASPWQAARHADHPRGRPFGGAAAHAAMRVPRAGGRGAPPRAERRARRPARGG
jgi:nucleoside-diphosphate-sugar epimerase